MVSKERNKMKSSNFITNAWTRFKESIQFRTKSKDQSFNEYFVNFDRLIFIALIGYVLVATTSIFVINAIENRENNFIFFSSLIVMLVCFIIAGLSFFLKSNSKTINIFHYFLILIMDVLFFCLTYFSIFSKNDIFLYIKYVYFFMLSNIIFAIFKFDYSYAEILVYLGYKAIVFSVIINFRIPNNSTSKSDNPQDTSCYPGLNNDSNLNSANEIICFCLLCICVFLFVIIKHDLIAKSMEFYKNNNFANEYFESLINTLNKSFLSVNLTKHTINTNKSLINLMKSLGVSDEMINENLFCSKIDDKNDENNPSLLKLRNLRKATKINKQEILKNSNLSSSNRLFLKKSKIFDYKWDSLNPIKSSKIQENNTNNNLDILNKYNNEKINIENNNNNEVLKSLENSKDKNPLNVIIEDVNIDDIEEKDKNLEKNIEFNCEPQYIDEETFTNRLSFFLDCVFSSFYAEEANKSKLSQSQLFKDKNSLSEAMREIFKSKNKCSRDENFISMGIYKSNEKKIIQGNLYINILLEIQYRKIKITSGEFIEFFFNDITQARNLEIEKSDNNLNRMVSSRVSHEFKIPLITIIYILKNYVKKSDVTKNKLNFENQTLADDYISNTIDLSDYMLSLINDIDDFSLIHSHIETQCEFDNFDLHELLLFSYRILKILINCRGLKDLIHPILEINDNVPRNFCSDEKRLKQILLNLITNSIKFTRRGYIKISAIISRENALLISIEDTGIGIQPRDIPKVFKDKAIPHNYSDTKTIGSNIGLTVCKKIIEKIGKFIQVESIPNKKTRFYFVLENKSAMKKCLSINDTIEKNLTQFKKSLMRVTTKSVKDAKIGYQNPRRPKSFNTYVQFSRMNDDESNKQPNYIVPRRLYSDYGEIIKNNNNPNNDSYEHSINYPPPNKNVNDLSENNEGLGDNKDNNIIKLNTEILDRKADFLKINFKNKHFHTVNLSVENLHLNDQNTFKNANNPNNLNLFQANKYLNQNFSNYDNSSINGQENIMSEENSEIYKDTKRCSEKNKISNFNYKLITDRTLNSSASLAKFPVTNNKQSSLSINIDKEKLNNKLPNAKNTSIKKKRSIFHRSNLNNITDKNLLKLIKPIKRIYEINNKYAILVVDDNKFLRKSLKNTIRQIFTDTTVEVIGCSDGIEILYLTMIDQIMSNRIKLIISDENMIYMNGTDANLILYSLQMEGKIPFIPFALSSAAPSDDDLIIKNKLSYIINKPPSITELKSIFMSIGLI